MIPNKEVRTAQQLITKIIRGEEINYLELNNLKFKLCESDIVDIIEKLNYTDKGFIKFVCRFTNLSDDFILNYIDLFKSYITFIFTSQRDLKIETIEILYKISPLNVVYKSQKYLTKEFIINTLDLNDKSSVNILSQNNNCDLEIIEYIKDNKFVDWYTVSFREDLTKEFIRENISKLNLGALLIHHKDKLNDLEINYDELKFYENLFEKYNSEIFKYKQQLFINEILSGRREDYLYQKNILYYFDIYRMDDSIIFKYMNKFNLRELEMIIECQLIEKETVRLLKERIKELS